MSSLTFRAHFDGKKVCLDEPADLAPNTPLLITVLTEDKTQSERAAWLAASQESLARAYGNNEPDYSAATIREEPPTK
jgi:hypothetical protein